MSSPLADHLKVYASECVMCHNITPGSMECDNCASDRYTVPLYVDDRAYADREALVLADVD